MSGFISIWLKSRRAMTLISDPSGTQRPLIEEFVPHSQIFDSPSLVQDSRIYHGYFCERPSTVDRLVQLRIERSRKTVHFIPEVRLGPFLAI